MPDFEIHGFDQEKAINLCARIATAAESEPWEDDYVTTIVYSEAFDKLGEPKPFIRAYVTKDDNADRIADILHLLDVDVEIMLLYKFISARKKDEYFV